MAGIGIAPPNGAAVAVAAGTPGASTHTTATADGATAVGLYSATFFNDTAIDAVVNGEVLPPAAHIGWTAADNTGLAAIPYTINPGGALRIVTQGFAT